MSALFEGADGDRLGCLIEGEGSTWQLSDDGAFLSDLEGYGIDVRKGGRAEFLARALRPANARVNPDTLQITANVDHVLQPSDVLGFLVALSHAQNVTFWTKERVRSTFKEDATTALTEILGEAAVVEASVPVDSRLAEFPADLVIRPRGFGEGGAVTAVFLVQAMDALTDALVLSLELRAMQRRDVRVAALIEDGSLNMGSPRATRAVNRIDTVSFFRNDEREAAFKVARLAVPNLSLVAA